MTKEKSYISGRDVRALQLNLKDEASALAAMDSLDLVGIGMDAIQSNVTTASISTPVQFLQNWLAGFVLVATAAQKIDEIVGISTAGNWEDEEVVQGVLENTGSALPYADYSNVPYADWNVNFERRTVVRYEHGIRVGKLEEARAATIRVNSAESKRQSAALALNIARNNVGFNGFNSGNNRTYGLLNDPNLPAYVTVSGGAWTGKTFLQITADIRTALAALRTQSQEVIDPNDTDITLAVATNRVEYLTVTSDFGVSVRQWIRETYPRVRVTSAPQLNTANGGANVFYLFAETVNDGSSDDNRTFVQVVPAKFQVLGVATSSKFYEEDYSNATAGVMLKRPYAVVRYSGI